MQNCGGANRWLTAPHEFITARMERIADCHQELQALVGELAAIQVVAQVLEQAGGEGEA